MTESLSRPAGDDVLGDCPQQTKFGTEIIFDQSRWRIRLDEPIKCLKRVVGGTAKKVAVWCILPDRREFGWEGTGWWGSTTDERAGERRDYFITHWRTVTSICGIRLNTGTEFLRILCVVSPAETPLSVILVRMCLLAALTVNVS